MSDAVDAACCGSDALCYGVSILKTWHIPVVNHVVYIGILYIPIHMHLNYCGHLLALIDTFF